MPKKLAIELLALLGVLSSTLTVASADELESYEVTTHKITRERLFDGVVEAVRNTTVSAQTQGRIVEINFDIDDFVEKDATLLKISDHEQSARVAQTAAMINETRAQLRLAEANFTRYQTLLASNSISRSEFDSAQTALQRTQANLETAQAAHEEALKQVDYTVVRAPYSGIVTARMVELGEAVSPGTPLMSGFSLDHQRVRTEVPNRFVQQIESEKNVYVVLDKQPEIRIKSSGITVFPFANPRSNSVTVRAELPEGTPGLYPGMLTKVAFETRQDTRILIPQSAIFNRSELTGVYILDAGKVSLRRVSTGRSHPSEGSETLVEVLSGLVVGERIALDPVAAVRTLKATHNEAESQQ